MKPNEALLNSKAIHLFRGYLSSIFSKNLTEFANDSTTFCLYREESDFLSREVKDIVLHVIEDEIGKTNSSELLNRTLIHDVIINEIVYEEYVSGKLQTLALENLIQNKLNKITNECTTNTNNFIIFEVPMPFSDFTLFKETCVECDESSEDDLVCDENEKSEYIGICNSTTSNASNEPDESICRVLIRFIERLYMDEKDFNIHLVLVSPFSKPSKDLLNKGMIEVHLPIEWDTSKCNMSLLIREVFYGLKLTEDIIELIIASVCNMGNTITNLLELCYEIRNSHIKKTIGRRLLNGESLNKKEVITIDSKDIEESIKKYNSRMFSLMYSSIDSLVSTKISIDDDFIGLKHIRSSIKEAVHSLEREEIVDTYSNLKNIKTEYGYPITWFLWGVTGSGKSTLVRSIVSLSPKVRVIICNVVEIISSFQGVTTRNLRSIFKNALNSRPCILVFDDIDTFLVMNSASDDSEGETRSKIQRELSETLLFFLDSTVQKINEDHSITDEYLNYLENSDSSDELDFTTTGLVRRIQGLMIIMTGKQDINDYPRELISMVQRHSMLTLPSLQEISEYYCKSGDKGINDIIEEIKEEFEKSESDILLNASEYELLIREKMYEKKLKV